MKTLTPLALCLALSTPAFVQAQTASPQVEVLDSAGFSGMIAQRGNLYVGSQPDEAGIKRMADAGVVTIINIRTDAEMKRLDFDEVALVEKLGMTYVHVPQGGSAHPYTPEALNKVSNAIAAAEGKPVLLHCASSGRASHMFAAWLYREQGVPLKEALAAARKIGFSPLAIEGLLNTQFEMRIPETTAPEAG